MELAEVLVIAAETLAELVAELIAELVSRTELEARVEIRQLKELKVFNSLRLSMVVLLAICCWDSLKS